MSRPVHRFWNAFRGKPPRTLSVRTLSVRTLSARISSVRTLAAAVMGFAYLLAATQLAVPVKAWIQSRAENPVKVEAFACSLHKCACQNALQCRAHCCCFPKAAASHSHGHEDGLDAHWAACGGGADEHGLMPPLPEHAPPAADAAVAGVSAADWIPARISPSIAPDPRVLFKVPIPLFS
ncbi:MAG TPA: hypothetical protein VJ385_23105 [Fibrobacteria bacterium]|nr:hypothetical protein [Fibrobacteria bacterium]